MLLLDDSSPTNLGALHARTAESRMPLTVRLESPVALYRKHERESYREFHATHHCTRLALVAIRKVPDALQAKKNKLEIAAG